MSTAGEFADTVIGIPGSRSEIVMLRPPGGGAGLELPGFIRPGHEPGSPRGSGRRRSVPRPGIAKRVPEPPRHACRLCLNPWPLLLHRGVRVRFRGDGL